MNFPDLYIDHEPSDAALIAAVATAFGVLPARVKMFGSYDELLQRDDETDVLIERLISSGEFMTRIGLYPQGVVALGDTADVKSLLTRLCDLLGARGVIPDDTSDDPTTFLLLRSGHLPVRVALDESRLARDEIVLAHVAASPVD